MSETPNDSAFSRGRETIRCAKCETVNLASAIKCHECGAHLFLVCPACGSTNLRTRRQCAACGGRIGRSRWMKLRDKVFRRFTPVQVFLAVVGLAVVVEVAVVVVTKLTGPEVSEPDAPEYSETVTHGPAAPAGGVGAGAKAKSSAVKN